MSDELWKFFAYTDVCEYIMGHLTRQPFMGGYYMETLSCSQISATHFKIWYLLVISTSAPFSNESVQWLDLKIRHLDGSHSNDHQGNMLYSWIIYHPHVAVPFQLVDKCCAMKYVAVSTSSRE